MAVHPAPKLPPAAEGPKRSSAPVDRWTLIRDLLTFQLKLVIDGVRDILLSPISLIAGLADLVAGGDRGSHYFYDVLHLGKRSERWINLFGAAEDVAAPDIPISPAEEKRIDALLQKAERALTDQVERGGVTAQAKDAIDRALDAVRGKSRSRDS
jgi:hypothetical protein